MFKKNKKITLPLKLLLGSGLIGLFVLFFIFIFYFSLPNIKSALNSSNQHIILENSNLLKQNTQNLIKKAKIHSDLTSQLLSKLKIQSLPVSTLEPMFRSILDQNPNFSSIYIALLNGDFFMIQKHKKGYVSKLIKNQKSILIFKDKNQNIKKQNQLKHDKFDPRSRPWFQKTLKSKKSFISDIYIFYTNQSLGLTVTHPVLDTKQVKGIVGIDIALDSLAKQTLETLENSTIDSLIIDENNLVIAAPSLANQISPLKSLTDIKSLENSPAKIAYLNYISKQQRSFSYFYKNDLFSASVIPFSVINGKTWFLVASISQNTFLKPVRSTYKHLVLATLALFGFLFLYLALISEKLTGHIQTMISETIKIKSMNFESKPFKNSIILEIFQLQEAILTMKKGLKSFKKYVPKQVVKSILNRNEEARISSEKKIVTVLFSDIQKFSEILEDSKASAITNQLSEYFETCSEEVAKFLGQVDKFVGDSIMAYWTQEDKQKDAILTCSCALSLIEKLDELNTKWNQKNKFTFNTRFGISTGEAIIGNIGSIHRLDYTIIGNCVNIANRLESANKYYDTKILINEDTYQLIKDELLCIPLDTVIFRNFKKPTQLYCVLEQINNSQNMPYLKNIKTFSDAIHFYKEKKWEKAYEEFKSIQKIDYPLPTDLFIKRIERLLKNHPHNWSPIIDYNQIE